MKAWYIAGRSNAAYRSSASLSIWQPSRWRHSVQPKAETDFGRKLSKAFSIAISDRAPCSDSHRRPPEPGFVVAIRLLLDDILRDPEEGVSPASFGSGRAEARDCL